MAFIVCWPDGAEFSKPVSLEMATNMKKAAQEMWGGHFWLKEYNQE